MRMTGPWVRGTLWASLIGLTLAAIVVIGLEPSPIQAQSQGEMPCNASVKYDASTNGSTRIVTFRADRPGPVRICGYTLWSGGTATVKFAYGTGTNCGTGTTDITPAFSFTTQTGITDSSPYYRGLNVPSGVDICIVTSAGVAVQAILYYVIR